MAKAASKQGDNMTSIRPDGYCKECGGYTQAVCFDTSGLCAACNHKKEENLKYDWFEKVLELFEPTEYLREKERNKWKN